MQRFRLKIGLAGPGVAGVVPILLCLLLVGPTVSVRAADLCSDLWISRNAIYNQVGYCFRSPLGMTLFDNSDCQEQPREASRQMSDKVARIRRFERQFDCAVDTSRTDIDVHLPRLRILMRDQPVANGDESTCIGVIVQGWIPLRLAKQETSRITGYVRDGDTIDFAHEPEGDWLFASAVRREGRDVPMAGWFLGPLDDGDCRAIAG